MLNFFIIFRIYKCCVSLFISNNYNVSSSPQNSIALYIQGECQIVQCLDYNSDIFVNLFIFFLFLYFTFYFITYYRKKALKIIKILFSSSLQSFACRRKTNIKGKREIER